MSQQLRMSSFIVLATPAWKLVIKNSVTLALTYSKVAYCQGLFSQLTPQFKTRDMK